MSEERIRVADARALADRAGKDWVVIVSVSAEGTQFTTWGRSPQDKADASTWAERLPQFMGCGPVKQVYESYVLDAAKNKARVEELEFALGAIAEVQPRPTASDVYPVESVGDALDRAQAMARKALGLSAEEG